MEKKKAEMVFNGMINVPNIRIEYRGFTIQPKLDMGKHPWSSNGNTYRRGYVVVRDGYQAMPGATWSENVIGAKVMVDSFIEANEDGQKFWEIMREKQGREEWDEV